MVCLQVATQPEAQQRDCDGQCILPLGQAACLPYKPRAGGIAVLADHPHHSVVPENAELLELVAKGRSPRTGLDVYRIDSITEQHGHILRLPPYHCQLNPMELVWSWVKRLAASLNTTFELKDVEALLPAAKATPDNWVAYVKYNLTAEKRMWELYGLGRNDGERCDAVV